MKHDKMIDNPNIKEDAERTRLRREEFYQPGRNWNRGAVAVSTLLPKLIDPICARRGLASSALIATWPELAGNSFADCSLPEKIQWPHQHSNGSPSYQGGILVIRIDGPNAIYLQHEEYQIIQRVNQFFGFTAIDRIKIVQAPITRKQKTPDTKLPELSEGQDKKLRGYIAEFDDPNLNEAVVKMGRGVLRRALATR